MNTKKIEQQILEHYSLLKVEREKLAKLDDEQKDNPLKQLKTLSQTSALHDKIDILKKFILEHSKSLFLKDAKNPLYEQFIEQFTYITTQNAIIKGISNSITNSKKGTDLAINFLQESTKLENFKNELLENVVSFIENNQIKTVIKNKV